MKKLTVVDIDTLRANLSYDADTGDITWLARPSIRCILGEKAGCIGSHGYYATSLYGQKMLNHRVAWALHYGEWPTTYVDHINGNKTDNRIANLRLATQSQNTHNAPVRKSNKLGVKGVIKKRDKYAARIWKNYKQIHLGHFDTIEEAQKAYRKAATAIYGSYAKQD